jgi:uncharacterized membrane protein
MPLAEIGPLTISEILDRMFTIYRRHFLVLIAISGLPYAMLVFVGALAGGSFAAVASRGLPDSMRVGMAAASGVIVLLALIVLIAFIIAAILAAVGTIAAVWDVQLGRKPGIRSAYRVAWRCFWPAVAAGILTGLAVGAGFILLIIPGIIVYLALSLANPIIVAEGSGGAEALSRSWNLTKGYRWKIFVAAFISGIVSWAISESIQLPMQVLATAVYKDAAPLWFTMLTLIGSLLGSVLSAPLLAIALCLIYYDARVRREGFDLQRAIDSLPPTAPGAPPTPAIG